MKRRQQNTRAVQRSVSPDQKSRGSRPHGCSPSSRSYGTVRLAPAALWRCRILATML